MVFLQKYLIYILSGVIAVVTVFGTVQYIRVKSQQTTIAKNEAIIDDLYQTRDALMGQVADYQIQLEKFKKAQAAQQKVTNDMAALLNQAENIKSTCEVDENDAKIIHNFVEYFNAGGVLPKTGSGAKADGKVLSAAGAPSVNRAHWTTKSLMTNLVKPLMEYSLNWEKTGLCYETD